MKKILFWPYQLYVWIVFLPVVVLLTGMFSALTIIAAALVNPQFASRVFAVTWARLCGTLTPMRVRVEGAENARREKSYIVVSNHQSMYDILVLYGWLRLDMKWVMKKELRKMPGIGIGCEKAGHIFVERSKPKLAAQVINEAVHRLGSGVGVLFFPEGTRSLDGRLLPFKKGAFYVAVAEGIPILPVTVTGTRDILPAKSLALFPGEARLIIHPAIDPGGRSLDQLDGIIAEARNAVESGLPPELR
jgi:1-acyl-sn-glycerol-3-phosphate acyltransferase